MVKSVCRSRAALLSMFSALRRQFLLLPYLTLALGCSVEGSLGYLARSLCLDELKCGEGRAAEGRRQAG